MAGFLKTQPQFEKLYLAGFHTSCCVQPNAEDLLHNTNLALAIYTGATAAVDTSRTQAGLDAMAPKDVEHISPNQFDWLVSAKNGFIYAPPIPKPTPHTPAHSIAQASKTHYPAPMR